MINIIYKRGDELELDAPDWRFPIMQRDPEHLERHLTSVGPEVTVRPEVI